MALLNCNPLLPRRSRLQWYRGRASILPMFRSLLLLTILTSVVAHVVEERRLIRSGVPRSRVRRQRSPTLVRDPLSVLSWRTIRGGGDSSSSRLEISKEWCTYIQNIDASNRTFYYQDAQDEIQGPFTRQELKNWRSQLPMDLPIMLQPEKIKAGSSVTLLAHLLEDEQLYNMWRMDVNDGTRDPENCGYCVSPTADEYQEEVNAQIAARTASSSGAYGGLGSVVSAEDGKGFYWQDVNGGWQGPFTEGVLENWKEHLPMDAALWLWDGEKFSEQPVEYAVVVGESHYLRHWRSRNPQMDPEVAGYGRGPTIGDYSRRMSLQNKEELEKMREIVKKKQQQELEQERKAGGANKTVKTRDQLILQQFAGCLDENDPARIAFLADPEMKEFDRKKKELVDMDGYYERPAHEEKMPDDARRQILEKQAEESREKWKYTNFGDNLIVDRDQEIEDRNLYGEYGLWLDPGTISSQMDNAYEYRRRKMSRSAIKFLKERKRKVRQKLMTDWLHDDDDIGDLMYAREITDPRLKEILKRPKPGAPLSRRKLMEKLAKERGEEIKPSYAMDRERPLS